MSLLKRIFERGGNPAEVHRERNEESDVDRVSCMDVVRMIRARVATFRRSKGMVVVLLEGCRVQIYFFDGISQTTWMYINHQFSTNRLGEMFLVGPPTEVVLAVDIKQPLAAVMKSEFACYDMSITPLWKLDRTAWDYEVMKALHGGDVDIRISFESLPSMAEMAS